MIMVMLFFMSLFVLFLFIRWYINWNLIIIYCFIILILFI